MIYKHITYGDWNDWRFKLKKAEGVFLWTESGQKLIDFTSGWNVTNLGWNNPEINQSIIEQIPRGTFSPIWTSSQIQEEYAYELTRHLPAILNTVIKTTGGTEANEVAIKLARSFSGRKRIIGFDHTYHGQLFASLAVGFSDSMTKHIGPMVPEITRIPYPFSTGENSEDANKMKSFAILLESFLEKKDVAAILVEPEMITGWGTGNVACSGFMGLIRDLTNKYSTLMIVDEVGTGFSRLGTLFGIQISGVIPDIITFAKAATNGASGLGVVVANNHIVGKTTENANYISTFGWHQLACAAGLTTLHIHERDKIWEKSKESGDILKNELDKIFKEKGFHISIRGKGLEIVADFSKATSDVSIAKKIEKRCFENGLHVVDGGDGCIPIMPPCVINESELRNGIQIFSDAVTLNLI